MKTLFILCAALAACEQPRWSACDYRQAFYNDFDWKLRDCGSNVCAEHLIKTAQMHDDACREERNSK